jgi:hypothetical protein
MFIDEDYRTTAFVDSVKPGVYLAIGMALVAGDLE